MTSFVSTLIFYCLFAFVSYRLLVDIVILSRKNKLGSTSSFLILGSAGFVCRQILCILMTLGFAQFDVSLALRVSYTVEVYFISLFILKNFVFSEGPFEQILTLSLAILFCISIFIIFNTPKTSELHSDEFFLIKYWFYFVLLKVDLKVLLVLPVLAIFGLWVFSITKKFNPKRKSFFVKDINSSMILYFFSYGEATRLTMVSPSLTYLKLFFVEVSTLAFFVVLLNYLSNFNKVYYIEHDISMEGF